MADADKVTERELGVLTTLHFVTQTQRNATIAEATGRAAMFLSATSMAFVALGFIAQAARGSGDFDVFLFALLATMLVIGGLTFVRAVQLGVEDAALAARNARIVARYREIGVALDQVIGATGPASFADAAVPVRVHGQVFMSASSMIAFVNAAILGFGGALALGKIVGAPVLPAAAAGFALFLAAAGMQIAYGTRLWRRSEAARPG